MDVWPESLVLDLEPFGFGGIGFGSLNVQCGRKCKRQFDGVESSGINCDDAFQCGGITFAMIQPCVQATKTFLNIAVTE